MYKFLGPQGREGATGCGPAAAPRGVKDSTDGYNEGWTIATTLACGSSEARGGVKGGEVYTKLVGASSKRDRLLGRLLSAGAP